MVSICQTIRHAKGENRKRFSRAQELAMKDVERVRGILKGHWDIVR